MAEKPEKKDKKDKATAASEAPVAAVPVEKKNTPPRPKTPQLAKKNKSRLPRRQKKALQKAANKKRGIAWTSGVPGLARVERLRNTLRPATIHRIGALREFSASPLSWLHLPSKGGDPCLKRSVNFWRS